MRYLNEEPLGDRLKRLFLKPADPAAEAPQAAPKSLEELAEEDKRANDKERLIGLLAAPLAAIIAITVMNALIANDPAARKNGVINKSHVPVSLYHELTVVLLVLCLAMLGFAFWRKRLFLGITMALFGLGIFNLHYWGFGIPFVIAAAWYLVRANRIHRDYKAAGGDGASSSSPMSGSPRMNKRYTPPRSRAGRALRS